MKRLFFFLVFIVISANSHGVLITNTIEFNNKLPTNNHFVFDMKEQGFNPATDTITAFNYSFDVREIVKDPFEDDADSPPESWEFVIIYDRFLFYRGIFFDMDTSVQNWGGAWYPTNECLNWIWTSDGEICELQPDIDGIFLSDWAVYTDNLWLNSISFTIDYIRKDVDEPSSLLLLTMLLFVTMFRFKRLSRQ